MTDPITASARNAAQQLAPRHGTGLTTAVERALQGQQTPDTYLDPTALGSLIVSAATLAWTVYKDLRTKTEHPHPDVITRTVRHEISKTHHLDADQDEVITITVQETLNAIPASSPDSE